jgi:hypothetical protein
VDAINDLAELELRAALDVGVRRAFESVSESTRHDTYIAALHVNTVDDDVRRPTVAPFFNTERRVAFVFTREWERERVFGWHESPPSSREEARWN